VGQLGALGRARGARGVEDDRGVVVVAVDNIEGVVVGADQLLELARLDEDELGAGVGGALLGGLGEAVPGKQDLGLGVGEIEADLALFQQHVHRHDDGAETQDAVVDRREVGDVGKHDPDTVAGLDALVGEQVGDPRRGAVELVVRELGLVELQRNAIGMLGGCRRQVLCQVHRCSLSSCPRAVAGRAAPRAPSLFPRGAHRSRAILAPWRQPWHRPRRSSRARHSSSPPRFAAARSARARSSTRISS
jgi:hypothetical protein